MNIPTSNLKMSIIATSLILLLSSSVSARTITTCGESSGFGAYLSNGNLGPQGNFSKDGFSGSKIVLESTHSASSGKTSADVVFYNSGTPYRASKDGPVALVNHNPTNGTWLVLAMANSYIDTYLFNLDSNGRGEVVWTNSRSGGTPKVTLMRAKCG